MPKSLGAIFMGAGKPLEITEFDIDEPMPNEVLIRNVACGLCHSDLHSIEGNVPTAAPNLLGHEAAGIVERVGANVTYIQPGDHVVVRTAFCGTCEECMSGNLHLCSSPPRRLPSDPPRISLDGGVLHTTASNLSGFAEWLLVPQNSCVKVREDVPLEVAALVGCAVITGIGAVFNTARVRPGTAVAVFGAGGIGLSVVQGARLAGAARIIAVDVHSSKLELARDFGATHVVNSQDDDPAAAVKALTGGKGAHYAFDAVGRADVIEKGLAGLRNRGVMTMIGILPAGDYVKIGFNSLQREKRLQSCSMGSNRFRLDIPMILDLYADGRLKLDEMISRRGPISEINDMFEDMKQGKAARQVVNF